MRDWRVAIDESANRGAGDTGVPHHLDDVDHLDEFPPEVQASLKSIKPQFRRAWIEMERAAIARLGEREPLSAEVHAAIEHEAFSGARLHALRVAREMRTLAQLRYDAAVLAAREVGYSWAELARVVGVSRQALQRRFAHR